MQFLSEEIGKTLKCLHIIKSSDRDLEDLMKLKQSEFLYKLFFAQQVVAKYDNIQTEVSCIKFGELKFFGSYTSSSRGYIDLQITLDAERVVCWIDKPVLTRLDCCRTEVV